MRVCHATHYSSSFLCFVSQLLIKQLESGLQLIHTSVVHRPIVKVSTEPIQTLRNFGGSKILLDDQHRQQFLSQ